MVMWPLTDQSGSDNQGTGNPLIAQVKIHSGQHKGKKKIGTVRKWGFK